MSYRIVKGHFLLFYQGTTRKVGSRPDGDSIWFAPDNPSHLKNLNGRSAKIKGSNRTRYVQLRFEAIDALELHYQPSFHQNLELSKASRDKALKKANFQEVIFAKNGESLAVSDATPHLTRGYIMTRSIDPFGRPVSFVFAGNINRTDGSDFFLTPAFMGNSINAALIRAGHAYPTFYTGLPTDLRSKITNLAITAWNRDAGLWPEDVSNVRTRINNLNVLQTLALWPKLFRRLAAYFNSNNTGLSGFNTWLQNGTSRNDQIWVIPKAELTHLQNVIDIQGNRIKLRYWPEEMVIVPR